MKFRTKLTAIISTFSVLLTVSLSYVSYDKFKNNLVAEEGTQRDSITLSVKNSVQDVEKAYQIFDTQTNESLGKILTEIDGKYAQNPNLASWDWKALKDQYGMDVYAFNDKDVIVYASLASDLGWDARHDAPGFADELDQKRQGTAFWADSVSLEETTGKIKKYAYIPTPDHKYVLEVGYDATQSDIFKKFDFIQVASNIKKQFDNVSDITVYNANGHAYGKSTKDAQGNLQPVQLSDDRLKNGIAPLKDGKGSQYEFTTTDSNVTLTSRYVASDFVPSNPDDRKFIEIIFNDKDMQQALTQAKQNFAVSVAVSVIIALLISFIIARLVARPMYLAFHDLLTGLTNRAGFENELASSMEKVHKKGQKVALMNIDLDNFKKVNDTLGHDGGDFLLKDVGRRIKASLRNLDDVAARLGGDEFVVLLNGVKDESVACEVARRILDELKRPIMIKGQDVTQTHKVTASIGIALVPEHAKDGEGLYKKADIALYNAKSSGKATYRVYNDEMKGEEK